MIAFPASMRIYVAVAPVDMRKQFNGLWAHAQHVLGEDPKGGALFVFANRNRDRLKILYFDGTGPWVLAKRLEQGRFSWPRSASGAVKLTLAPEALAMLAGGIELRAGCAKASYER